MTSVRVTANSIDEYIAACPPEVRTILQQLRASIHAAAPEATERISYQMPCFEQNGALVYFGAFKNHIGFYPPVRDPELQQAAAAYAGEKGNLRFPLSRPLPLELISELVRAKVRENQLRLDLAKAKRGAKKAARP